MSTLTNEDLFIVQRPSGGSAGTYKVQWREVLANIAASPGVDLKSTANFTTTNDDPASKKVDPDDPDSPVIGRQNGDMWINSTAGTFAWANPSVENKQVAVGDYCIWDGTVWQFLAGVGGGAGGVTSVDATAPLIMKDSKTSGSVTVESRTATTSQSGHVARLATSSDISSGTSGAVVDAALLKASLPSVSVSGVNPNSTDTPDIWQNNADTSTYDTPAIGVYNGDEVFAYFATENQVGVNYLAYAGTGAIMDFTGAENYKPDTANGPSDPVIIGGNLDNFGSMTTRRTYNNFVPRDFNLLNQLP